MPSPIQILLVYGFDVGGSVFTIHRGSGISRLATVVQILSKMDTNYSSILLSAWPSTCSLSTVDVREVLG
jgi:hypothetical protein